MDPERRERLPVLFAVKGSLEDIWGANSARCHQTWEQNVLVRVNAGGLPFPAASVVGNGHPFFYKCTLSDLFDKLQLTTLPGTFDQPIDSMDFPVLPSNRRH